MSTHHYDPLKHPEVQQGSFFGYLSAFVISVVLLLAAMLLTVNHVMAPLPLLVTISVLALLVLAAQSLLFFGLDFSQANVWKSVSLLLTVPLFILTVGLTVWMFHSLYGQTMLPEMPGMSMQPTLLQ